MAEHIPMNTEENELIKQEFAYDSGEDVRRKISMLCQELEKTLLRKNHDYGNSVHDTYERYGNVSYLTRMDDKINRMRQLAMGVEAQVNDEALADTILDLAGYCILFAAELR